MLYVGIMILLALLVFIAVRKAGGTGCLLVLLVAVFVLSMKQCDEDEDRGRIDNEKAEKAYEQIRENKKEYIRKGWVKPPRMNPPTTEDLRQDSINH